MEVHDFQFLSAKFILFEVFEENRRRPMTVMEKCLKSDEIGKFKQRQMNATTLQS